MATINATSPHARLPIVERIARNVDRAAVERAAKELAEREAAERIEFLYGRLFGNVATGRRMAAALRTEDAALRAFGAAVGEADNRLQVEVLCVAIDNRWATVVNAFIKVWDGEHPIADTVNELWHLTTTGRAPA